MVAIIGGKNMQNQKKITPISTILVERQSKVVIVVIQISRVIIVIIKWIVKDTV